MSTDLTAENATERPSAARAGMKLEVIVIPVADPERAKDFYLRLGWRLDADVTTGDDFRVIQVTPPASPCSVIFGTNVTQAAPGSAQGLHLIVSDVEAAAADLAERGVAVGEPFHDVGGVFHHGGTDGRLPGVDPGRASYGSFASFEDPDGNGWVFQEISTRLPNRVTGPTYRSPQDLEQALRRAEEAHGRHEERTGEADLDWPRWYADHMTAEQSGDELPE